MSSTKLKKRKSFVDLSDDLEEATVEVAREPQTKQAPSRKSEMDYRDQIINNSPYVNQKTKSIDDVEDDDEIIAEPEPKRIAVPKKIAEPKQPRQRHSSAKPRPVPEKPKTEKPIVINDNFQIASEESLDKGFHFYSNDRVMDKVKRLAKEKNIKLSKLITMILDKAIKEE